MRIAKSGINDTPEWQSHSIHGPMSRALKKKLRLKVESKKVEGLGRIYRIAG
jgi:hypothetical protein